MPELSGGQVCVGHAWQEGVRVHVCVCVEGGGVCVCAAPVTLRCDAPHTPLLRAPCHRAALCCAAPRLRLSPPLRVIAPGAAGWRRRGPSSRPKQGALFLCKQGPALLTMP